LGTDTLPELCAEIAGRILRQFRSQECDLINKVWNFRQISYFSGSGEPDNHDVPFADHFSFPNARSVKFSS
jgi:hypothetical protein